MSRTVSVVMQYQQSMTLPDGERVAMFLAAGYDEVDEVNITITGVMSENKWNALGKPRSATFDIVGE